MNNVHALETLCGAGHYFCGFENHAKKDEGAFAETVEMFKQADTIIFNSMISNEEAMILQSLKKKYGYKLINKEAKKFQEFMSSFNHISGKHLYSGSLDVLESCEAVLTLGCSVSTDNPALSKALEKAHKEADAYIAYMHPLEDVSLKDVVSQHIKYEVGSEEGLLAMLANLVVNEEGKKISKSFFDDLDIGYICGESSVGEEEFDEINEKILSCKKYVLVIGSDVFNHPRAKNIAKILGMISKYSDFEILMIPSELNTLGVSLICDLDEKIEGKTIGYNVEADFTLSFLGKGNLDMPSLKQQEGTYTSLDKQVLQLNKAIDFEGYRLNDIANALGLEANRTIDYTAKLPVTSGYKAVAFDDLESSSTVSALTRGYALENLDVKSESETLDEVDEISEFNGTVIYRCNHSLSGFGEESKCSPESELLLLGSKQFATAAKITSGTMVRFEMDGKTYQRKFEVLNDLKGTIAYNPVFDSTDNYDEYRYKRVNLEEVNG